MLICAARPRTDTPAASPVTRTTSSPLRRKGRDGVGRAVPDARGGREVQVHLADVGPAQVVDDDVVGAAEGVEVDRLDVVQVHQHVRHVPEERRAPAVGRDVDVLRGVRAVEEHRVEAGLALERVVVVARVPDEGVVSSAHERGVVAVAAVDEVVAAAADENIDAEAAVHRHPEAAGLEPRRVDHVVAAEAVERQAVEPAGVGAGDAHLRRQPRDSRQARGVGGGGDRVGAVGAVRGHVVRRPVCCEPVCCEVERDASDVGAGHVADHDVVGASERVEGDALDVVEVHRHVRDVAEEDRPPAVGEDVDVLGGARSVEQELVGAVLAFDRVAAVARIPLEAVVAGAEERHVVAVVAEDEVPAGPAEEHVGALAAEHAVVPGAAIDGQADHPRGERRRGDGVVSAEPVDDEVVVRALGIGDRDLRRQPRHA